MSAKTILIAHRSATVRERFSAALADARHASVTAATETMTLAAIDGSASPVSLALVDLGLAADRTAFVQTIRQHAGRALPLIVFAGTVGAASDVPVLLGLGVAGYVNEHAATAQILPALAPHLFPDNFNRRTSTRVVLGIPVSYRAGTTIAGAVTLDVGKGGVSIRTITPLAPGSSVMIRFRLPGAPGEIEASGRVAWSDRKVGMGIRFEHVAVEDQEAIDLFVEGSP